MAQRVSLTEMKVNEAGRVVEFFGGHGMAGNLENMGIRIGVEIRKAAQQFMRGPVVVIQNRTTVAIGFGMAQRIIVEVGREK